MQRSNSDVSLAEIIARFPLQILEEANLRLFVWGDRLAVSVIRDTDLVDQFTGCSREEVEEVMPDILIKHPSNVG